MRKYLVFGTAVAFIVIFNLGYVFHEILMGDFFKEKIGAIQREDYNIPIIALAFLLYTLIQAWLLPIFYSFARANYHWSLMKTAIVFGSLLGFLWDGLQGGMIEVATFKMPAVVFWVDSGYHTVEGMLTAVILSSFYGKLVCKSKVKIKK
ncbi:MAG TPA: hypothetical protein VK666_08355 [Chryseolinea sp.]|nr:hypothetical protein [Chryseolinea sp.]